MTITCDKCVHKNVCGANLEYFSTIFDWNSKHPYIQLNENVNLAESCNQFKTLSDIHIQSSNTLQKIIERLDQIKELNEKRKAKPATTKESSELEQAFDDANILFETLNADEKNQAKQYASKIPGVKTIDS